MIALVLAEALRDRQLDGALLGFHRVEPAPDCISLYPHPAMANRVIRELLPRLDDEYYGDLRGVPGLRARWHRGKVILYDLTTNAQVHVIWPRRSPPVAVNLESPGHAIWRYDRLDTEEADGRAWWTGEAYSNPGRPSVAAEVAARDWLLSRVLRRVALVNRGASLHGFANTYSHDRGDLVVESCCGTDPSEVKRLLCQSGMAAPPEDPLLETLEASRQRAGEISLARHIRVTFRCMDYDECVLEPGRADAHIDKQLREWYS